jgi:hypothetical protein
MQPLQHHQSIKVLLHKFFEEILIQKVLLHIKGLQKTTEEILIKKVLLYVKGSFTENY